MEAKLGHTYRDTITGFEGKAMSIVEYLYGCRRVGLSALVDGKPEEFLFDEPGLEEVESPKVTPIQDTGGPHGYRR